MDNPSVPVTPDLRFNPLLPYYAVFRTDLRQTARSWVFRLWVLLSLAAAIGYGLYKFGIHREVGLVQSASEQTGVLLRTVGMVTLAFVSLIALSGISSERGTVADSILSRGISRHQYFLAKWHSRSAVLLLAFAGMAAIILTGYHYLLEPDLKFGGCVAATLIAMSILAAVIAWGVTVGALSNGTMIGITIFWIVLFGVLFLLSFLPDSFPTSSTFVANMRSMLRGNYESSRVANVVFLFLVIATVGATIGLLGFGKKDV
jgi:ABC-2 type transport system permease protein